MTDDLERLALAMDAAEDAVIAASGQHREDLWSAAHEAKRQFHDAADPQTVLALIRVVKAASDRPELLDAALMWTEGSELHPRFERWVAGLRSALAAIGEGK